MTEGQKLLMISDDADVDRRFALHVTQLNIRGARYAGILIALLVPLFSILDYFVLREVFEQLVVLRLGVGVIAAGILIWTYRVRRPQLATALTMALFLAAGISIVVMVHLHDRLDYANSPSNYYAGLMLVIVGATLLATWKVWQSAIVFGTIYILYLVPSLLFLEPSNKILYLSNNFFLVSTILVATVGQYFTYNLQQRDVYASFRAEKAAQDLEDVNTRLKDLDKYKTQFFANITHELKTPLTLILAPTEAILRGEIGQFSEGQQEYFRRIYHNGLRLMKLISDLLDLARLEESKVRLRVERTDLGMFLSGLLNDIRPLAERKGITLSMNVVGASTIFADRHRLEQVFVNLLSNAVKFTQESGQISVSLKGVGDSFVVSVADSGIGIPADMLGVIFDRFSQVDGSSTRKYGGTGIGLALAKELVELHGGRIWAESELGQGTTVHVKIPVGRAHLQDGVIERRALTHDVAVDRRQDGALPEWWEQLTSRNEYRLLPVEEVSERRLVSRDSGSKKGQGIVHRLLVVEDSREMLQFLHMQLSEHFELFLAENGARGWELAQRFKPDLVVTDYMMPEMDGRELTRLLKNNEQTKLIPVVMLTAKTDLEDRMESRKAGADQYLAKPFSSAELLQVIRSLLKTKEVQTESMLSHRMDSLQLVSARMAHEIHNPLNYIKNGALIAERTLNKLLELCEVKEESSQNSENDLLRAKLAERMKVMISQITKGADNISGSVELLREYSREGYRADETLLDVEQGLKRILAIVSSKDGSVRSTFLSADGAGSLCAVQQEFNEVFTNLIQNAIDAGHPNGNVWVSAMADVQPDWVRIVVRDDGSGIAEGDIERIFVPLFTTKEPGQGMGMGLAIAHRLIRKAGAHIQVQSAQGVGTTFEVTWPRASKRSSEAG